MNDIVDIIGHCDNEECDLGTLNYKCPHCNKLVTDYDGWWNYRDLYINGKDFIETNCPDCKTRLIIKYDNVTCEYRIVKEV